VRRRLNLVQRVLLVVALGAALLAVDTAIAGNHSGWFGYAPNSGVSFDPEGLSPIFLLVVRILLISIWTATALWLLRTEGRDGSDEK
jgi:heme/copper-type cytochrome/quinol oxidase subunit 1